MENHLLRQVAYYLFAICFIVSSIIVMQPKDVSAAYTRYVTADSLSIRTKASVKGDVVGTYLRGNKITCYAKSGNWTKVKYEGHYRYVASSYLSAKKTTATVSAKTSKYSKYVTASTLSIRKKATVDSKELGVYLRGDKATCVGTSGRWTKVKRGSVSGYVSSNFLSGSKPSASVNTSSDKSTGNEYTRYITASTLTLREKATVNSKALDVFLRGDKATCVGTSGGWTKVKKSGMTGYVSSNFLSSSKPASSSSSSGSSSVSGSTIANDALDYLGLRYVWGGESLRSGVDCSGFTKCIYAKYGYSLPHSARAQRDSGRYVSASSRRAGDLICYTAKNGIYHVGIYIGNNKVVHASGVKTGVKISTWNYRTVHSVRRVLN